MQVCAACGRDHQKNAQLKKNAARRCVECTGNSATKATVNVETVASYTHAGTPPAEAFAHLRQAAYDRALYYPGRVVPEAGLTFCGVPQCSAATCRVCPGARFRRGDIVGCMHGEGEVLCVQLTQPGDLSNTAAPHPKHWYRIRFGNGSESSSDSAVDTPEKVWRVQECVASSPVDGSEPAAAPAAAPGLPTVPDLDWRELLHKGVKVSAGPDTSKTVQRIVEFATELAAGLVRLRDDIDSLDGLALFGAALFKPEIRYLDTNKLFMSDEDLFPTLPAIGNAALRACPFRDWSRIRPQCLADGSPQAKAATMAACAADLLAFTWMQQRVHLLRERGAQGLDGYDAEAATAHRRFHALIAALCDAFPTDARLWVMKGNRHLQEKQIQPALDCLEKAAALDATLFGVQYTLGNMYRNLRPHHSERKASALLYAKKEERAFRLFLASAPDCHWHVPIASWCLVPLLLAKLATASPTGQMSTNDMVRAHPNEVREALDFFNRGERALKVRSAFDRPDGCDFAARYADAKEITKALRMHGRKQATSLPTRSTKNRCAFEGCGIEGKLLACAACNSVWYCGREHQKLHWPHHKADCRIFRERAAAPSQGSTPDSRDGVDRAFREAEKANVGL